MLPCSEVHWKILPSVSRELAVMLEKEHVPRSRIASALGTSGAAVSQYISGKRGGEKLAPKAIVACGKLAKRIAAGKVTEEQMLVEMAKIIVLAKKSKLGKKDPCVICMSGS